MSPAFANALAAARPDFNRRFAEARNRYPELTSERFSTLMKEGGDAIVQSAEKARPGIGGEVAQVVFEAGLVLSGQRLAGPDARHPWVNTAWTQLVPDTAALLATSPARVLHALTNAVCHLAAVTGARPSQWLDLMRAAVPRCASVETLLLAGQVAAWRAGLAHYRTAALAAAASLPRELALELVDAPAFADWTQVRARLEADPWYSPRESPDVGRLRLVKRVGAFRGFGGLFPQPPKVAVQGRELRVISGIQQWLLTADFHGNTFHRVEDEPGVGAAGGVSLSKGITLLRGIAQRGRETVDVSDLGEITSAVTSADGTTLALTGASTHAVILIALT